MKDFATIDKGWTFLLQVIKAKNMYSENDEWKLTKSEISRADFLLDDPAVADLQGFNEPIPLVSIHHKLHNNLQDYLLRYRLYNK